MSELEAPNVPANGRRQAAWLFLIALLAISATIAIVAMKRATEHTVDDAMRLHPPALSPGPGTAAPGTLSNLPEVAANPKVQEYLLELSCRAKSGGKVEVDVGGSRAIRDFNFGSGTHVPPVPPEVQTWNLTEQVIKDNDWAGEKQTLLVRVLNGQNMTVTATLKDASGKIRAGPKTNASDSIDLGSINFVK